MKIYFSYIISSLLTAWVILFLYSVSAGFASFAPIVALFGALLLFAIAAPLLLYNSRIGLILGCILLTMMLPYTIGYAKSVLDDRVFNWGVILSLLPALLTLFALYLSIKQIFFQPEINFLLKASASAKFLFAAIPVSITLLYFVFYGREWF
ncbi:hypothetical protein [Flavihumibacter fluvii]|uniref:hypothetical protein n=1 Tax=Flavihumibacter fluvii TaxID=2838157 RepID=UPI001BDEEE33|nr:hypothetical protein [Flavihumibacter fluvii]ULQ51059.1 hypothetical protein KJS93_13290 [Flavihumibacter fluvii]